MMWTLGGGEAVDHLRWSHDERNSHGKLIPAFHDPVLVDGVGVDVPKADEPRDGATGRQMVNVVVFLPPGTVVDGRDQFKVRGVMYEVEGDSPPINNFFTGSPFMTEVKLRRVTG